MLITYLDDLGLILLVLKPRDTLFVLDEGPLAREHPRIVSAAEIERKLMHFELLSVAQYFKVRRVFG